MATAKLARFRAKRDFSKTAEPSGDVAIAPSDRLRFVVQKHAATRLYYDLRLELDEGFKSWAVTKGPSRDPDQKHLAVEVEDHPLDYGDFEGLQLRVQGGKVTLRTRKGLDWTRKFQAIADAAEQFPDCIIDGEAVALDENGTPDFSALQAALSDGKSEDLVSFAFDLMFHGGEDLRLRPLSERKQALSVLLEQEGQEVATHIRYSEHFEEAGDAVFKSACRLSLEGIISKRLDPPYQSRRSDSWTKAKCRGGQEVVIGGWTQPASASDRCWSVSAAANISSMPAGSAPASARPSSRNCCLG